VTDSIFHAEIPVAADKIENAAGHFSRVTGYAAFPAYFFRLPSVSGRED
jgi:hypothetical protein